MITTGAVPLWVELATRYGLTVLMFCLLVQSIAILTGRLFKMPALQRIAIAITCSYTGFFVLSRLYENYYMWLAMFGMIFYATYFLTPKYVGEDKRTVTIHLSNTKANRKKG